MQESFRFGISTYVSSYEEQAERLALLPPGSVVFTSLHFQEEMKDRYRTDAFRMLNLLRDRRCRVIADVSRRTLSFFGAVSLAEFAREAGLERLRIDYGFSTEEMAAVAASFPVAINASTIDVESAVRIRDASPYEVFAIHNFYPRPETGLDREYLVRTTQALQERGIRVFAFIAGDSRKRGPIFEGLPTLEAHRDTLPYVACLELLSRYGLDGAFVGDMEISPQQSALICDFLKDGEVRIPCSLYSQVDLYDRSFTVRGDSPCTLLRLAESREYATGGRTIEVSNTVQRLRGSITMDNNLYSRYSGEVQVIRKPLPADRRVNVIGNIDSRYVRLLECVKNGHKIRLIRSW